MGIISKLKSVIGIGSSDSYPGVPPEFQGKAIMTGETDEDGNMVAGPQYGVPAAITVDFPDHARRPDGEHGLSALADGINESCNLWEFYNILYNHFYTDENGDVVRMMIYAFDAQYQVNPAKLDQARAEYQDYWEDVINSIANEHELETGVELEVEWGFENKELRDAILAETQDQSRPWFVTEQHFGEMDPDELGGTPIESEEG